MAGSLRLAAFIFLFSLMSLNYEANSMTRWCGVRLVQALQLICNGRYYDMFNRAKSNDITASGLIRRLRRSQGVVEECCHRGCTLADLQTYCAM